MRIVIDVEGEKVTVNGPDTGGSVGEPAAPYGDPLPGAAPPELLARAKKLGAKSAGAAQFGRGAALAAPAVLDAEVMPARRARKRAAATARKRKSSRKKPRR
jgi:hypothetical protein